MAILSIMVVVLLKISLLMPGEIEYFVSVKFSDNLFALNQRDVLLSLQFKKKDHLRLCLKEINWYCRQAWQDLVFQGIYKDQLRKLRRAMWPR